MSNVAGKAYGLNIITPMKPWKTCINRFVFMLARALPATLSGLLGLSLIHFARWVAIKRNQWPDLGQGKQQIQNDYMLFCSNFNGTWDQYIDAFSDGIPNGLDVFWYSSTTFPQSIPITPFKEYKGIYPAQPDRHRLLLSTAKYCQPTAEAAAACVADVDGDASGCAGCTGGLCVTVTTTIWEWVTQLNRGAGFAGHTDWRVPTLSELAGISDIANYNFFVGNGVFNQSGCSMDCTDITSAACSCTREDYYWSATTFGSTDAWLVFPGTAGDNSYHNGLILSSPVRAVRGSS